MLALVSLLVALVATSACAQNVIVPGAVWKDTSGNTIQAHGAGLLKVCEGSPLRRLWPHMLQVGSTFYWFGEDKSHNSALFKAVSCYAVSLRRIFSRPV